MAMAMAARLGPRAIFRRFSTGSSGKVLSEEEKAAENVYIKKVEQEKLEKLARKGYNTLEEHPTEVKTTDAKPSSSSGSSVSGMSTDKNRNYAVLSGVIAIAASVGWYLKSTAKKPEDVQD